MKNWSKVYLIDPKDMDHLLGELKLNNFNAYDPDTRIGKLHVEGKGKNHGEGIGGFLFTKDTSWIGGRPFYVWGERLDTFMQKYRPSS